MPFSHSGEVVCQPSTGAMTFDADIAYSTSVDLIPLPLSPLAAYFNQSALPSDGSVVEPFSLTHIHELPLCVTSS
ncbi:hypothetical protein [Bacteroides xylanisolvens]|uniref:hypothetical protein n=1 Tax=Bacteroides xylanisolvens TaxID=371601 RepID=UPI0034A5C663